MIRHRRREADRVGVIRRFDPGRHQRDRLHATPSLEGEHHGLPRQHGEQLSEGSVEVRSVQLVDHEPTAALDGVDEHAGPEDEALGRGLEATDGLEGGPLGGGGRREVAGAQHGPLGDLCRQVGEGGLARARRAGQHDVLAASMAATSWSSTCSGKCNPFSLGLEAKLLRREDHRLCRSCLCSPASGAEALGGEGTALAPAPLHGRRTGRRRSVRSWQRSRPAS